MNRTCSVVASAIAVLSFQSRTAAAWAIGSQINETGCHEPITAEALRRARSAYATAPVLAPTRDEAALIDDVLFSPPADFIKLVEARWFEFLCANFQFTIKQEQAIANIFQSRLLARLDGRRRLRQVIADTATELTSSGTPLDPAGLERAAVPMVKRMLEAGFVEPA